MCIVKYAVQINWRETLKHLFRSQLFILQIWEDGWNVLRFQMHVVMHVRYPLWLIKKAEHQKEQGTTLMNGMHHSPSPLFLMMSCSTAGQSAAENTNDVKTLSMTLFPVWGKAGLKLHFQDICDHVMLFGSCASAERRAGRSTTDSQTLPLWVKTSAKLRQLVVDTS